LSDQNKLNKKNFRTAKNSSDALMQFTTNTVEFKKLEFNLK